MGACNSYLNDDLSPSIRSFKAIKEERKLLLLGLSEQFEEEFINKMQSSLCMNQHQSSFIGSKYNFGALTINESTPNNLPWNTMNAVDKETYAKLIKCWDVIDYDVLLKGWFRQNYNDSFPNDIVKFMKMFCCIPSVTVDSYKLKGNNTNNNVFNMLNISSIYRRCWALTNNKECFRHKELSFCFKQSTATLLLVDLSCYNEIDDKTDTNKMHRTIKLCQWFLKDYSLYLKKNNMKYGNVLVILDEIEAFKHKLRNNIAISDCCLFSKYDGANDYDSCKSFIRYKFKALNLYPNIRLKIHFNIEDDFNFWSKIPRL